MKKQIGHIHTTRATIQKVVRAAKVYANDAGSEVILS